MFYIHNETNVRVEFIQTARDVRFTANHPDAFIVLYIDTLTGEYVIDTFATFISTHTPE